MKRHVLRYRLEYCYATDRADLGSFDSENGCKSYAEHFSSLTKAVASFKELLSGSLDNASTYVKWAQLIAQY